MSQPAWEPRRFNFDPLGGRETASSRLRAWMVADQLNEWGYEATVNDDVAVHVQVFQKRINYQRLREARECDALVVFDFDDNVLLEEFGRKSAYLGFMNAADIITVGSPWLVQTADAFHDRVLLLENPLDVLPGSDVKRRYEWRDRLGWFGNPVGLVALEDTGMREATRVVTRQGDIAWSLETIDETVRSFDVVLIPVRSDGWTEAKNAHRLLKCAALGVPFLASRTPAHERAVHDVGLPEWLLVEGNESWRDRVAAVRARYDELPDALQRASRTARELYGIGPVVRRWLDDLAHSRTSAHRPLGLSPAVRAQLGRTDVLVLNENEPELATRTLDSLRLDEVRYRSVRLVSALPMAPAGPMPPAVEVLDEHEDFFDVYASIAALASTCDGTSLLFVRAGVELTRGFFHEVAGLDETDAVYLFALQRSAPDFSRSPDPPTRVDRLLEQPYVPALLLCPAAMVRAHGGLRPIVGALGAWDLLIGLATQHGARLEQVLAPVAWVDHRTEERTAMDSYRRSLAHHDALASGRGAAGWHRLQFVWQSAVIEAHRAVFGRYVSTIVPNLTRRYARLEDWAFEESTDDALPATVGARWLDLLRQRPVAHPLRLVRGQDGGVYLIDRGSRREVASALLVRVLERAFGPAAVVTEEDMVGWEAGPPVVVFADEFHEHFLIAGDKRYPVSGLLLPWQVASGDLAPFELAETVLDLTEWE